MIKNIHIRNYALIDKTDIELEKGFTIITGETGAGKSILLGAIGLTLGQRADVAAIMDKSRKCVVEITYNVVGYDLQRWFVDNDLDYDDFVVVRRELMADGKSRAFINDTPVNNKVLKEFGSFLIDVHSQHQSLLIGQPEYQLEILDAFCGNQSLLKDYKVKYARRQGVLAELNFVKQKAREAAQEEDYLKFQFNQLDEARLREGEQRELEEELAVLNNAESIKSAFSESTYVLTEAEVPVIPSLKGLKNKMASLEGVVKEATDYEQRLNSVILELEDIADECERVAERVEYNPVRVDTINDRLNVMYDLLHKHRVERTEDLITLKEALGEKLKGIQSFATQIEELEKQINVLEKEMDVLAGKIHKARVESEQKLREEMRGLLVGMGIKHAVFKVVITPLDHFTPTGKDDVSFLFAANKNQEPGELAKVASGGEISRLMLSLKYILSRTKQLPVIIFDEIDTGVSGEIAHSMAAMMKEMAERMQVISISHLPQIAAAGDTHFKVYKEDDQEGTISRIRRLTDEERVIEIAGMISGSVVSKAALENARLLLGQF
ncbi:MULTISPECIES: DNA repair protein RecN [Odoribacteraceae]|uniref:DNA repair protein RecN n=1 Tax=Odoribacteraceae TaxID=1853231 RepID=UPI000E4E1495|nr:MULTISPECIES: DNA repair protein RecN [Odoribacteraceae]MCQ4874859.1 DNA repair protein RecN [Butyricimonas paravirosa]RHR83070.1 DNA repair protein RecN [Odoribacter sp. AF15-53]